MRFLQTRLILGIWLALMNLPGSDLSGVLAQPALTSLPLCSPVLDRPDSGLPAAYALLPQGLAARAPVALEPQQTRPRSGTERSNPRTQRRPTPKPAATQPVPAEEPLPAPDNETLTQAAGRLPRLLRREKVSPADRALYCGVQFCLAVARAEAQPAAGLLDAVGYQPLPLEGQLPAVPAKPQTPADFEQWLATQPPRPAADVPMAAVSLLRRHELVAIFPAVAQWMLPDDFAFVATPLTAEYMGRESSTTTPKSTAAPSESQPGTPADLSGEVSGWVTRPACLVIRVRGARATIQGGNWFEALPASPR